jgi:serine/threonine protein kinase
MTGAAIDRLTTALADRYRIERELGQGGMATVYLAEDVRHRRKVALKVLHPELSAVLGPERFLKEIELTASLQHPHILPLFDSGSADGQLFYVMPFVDGETLRTRSSASASCPSARRSASPPKWPTPSCTPTVGASSTATSSRRTSCSRAATRWSRTSGSRSPCSRPAGSA